MLVLNAAVAITVAVAIAIAVAVAVAVAVAIAHRSYKCIAEIVAFCFALALAASSHHAYEITTLATLETKILTCTNGFGLILICT